MFVLAGFVGFGAVPVAGCHPIQHVRMELTAEQMERIEQLPAGVHSDVTVGGVVVKFQNRPHVLTHQAVAQLLNGAAVSGVSDEVAAYVRTHAEPAMVEPALRYTKQGFEIRHEGRVLERLTLDELVAGAHQRRAVVTADGVCVYEPRQLLRTWNEGDVQDLAIRRACERAGVRYESLWADEPTTFDHVREEVNVAVRRQPRKAVITGVLLVLALGLTLWNIVGAPERPPDVPVAEQIRRQLAIIDRAERQGALGLEVMGPRIVAFDRMDVDVDELAPEHRANYQRLREIVEQWRPRYEAATR